MCNQSVSTVKVSFVKFCWEEAAIVRVMHNFSSGILNCTVVVVRWLQNASIIHWEWKISFFSILPCNPMQNLKIVVLLIFVAKEFVSIVIFFTLLALLVLAQVGDSLCECLTIYLLLTCRLLQVMVKMMENSRDHFLFLLGSCLLQWQF